MPKQPPPSTRDILRALADKNPYHDKERAYLWATGYLAATLAGIIERDQFLAKKIAGQLDLLKDKPRTRR